jgi:hypothetical protein
MALSFLVLAVLLPASPGTVHAQTKTIVINTTLDIIDFGGTQTIADLPGPDGLVSLAEGVIAANNSPGPDTIAFNIPTTDPNYNLSWLPGAFVLSIEDSAPLIIRDNGTTIDGTTQTAFTGDTAVGPEIHVRTTPPYANAPCFVINSDGNTVRGIQGFSLFRYGVDLNGNGNVVVGNFMTQPGIAAVRVVGHNNRIGGVKAADANRLSSAGSGVWLSGPGATANIVQGNVIWRNWGDGVTIDGEASGNTIGGPGAAGNVIFANGHMSSEFFPVGSSIEVSGHNNFIIGNRLGLDEVGQANAGSVWSGIALRGSSNLIQNNVIVGHAGHYFGLTARPAAVRLSGGTKNVIAGNWIGIDPPANIPAGNGYGIKAEVWNFSNVPTDHTIGGTTAGSGNVIAFSQHDGIAIGGGARGIRILGNSIFQNGELGINLGVDPYTQAYPNTVTPNDPGDGDTGANDLQNFPAITSASFSGGYGTEVRGMVDTPNPKTVRIELFVNETFDPTGFGEGGVFAGSATPAADGQWSTVLAGNLYGRFITATATDEAGNTSEFSRAVPVSLLTDSRPPISISSYDPARFAFSLEVSPGKVVIIECSTNLVHWTPLSTNVVMSTPFRFSHSAAAAPRRFYRARLQ